MWQVYFSIYLQFLQSVGPLLFCQQAWYEVCRWGGCGSKQWDLFCWCCLWIKYRWYVTALGINVVFADACLVQILTRSCLDLNPAFDCHNPIKYVMLCYVMLCYAMLCYVPAKGLSCITSSKDDRSWFDSHRWDANESLV